MKGIAYCVGVGPGDPELMTQKAVRLIRENDVIAVPGKVAKESAAYRVALAMIPELENKELVPVYMPMINDHEMIEPEHEKAAKLLENYMDKGKNVVYITLGDPSVYCSFSYIQRILEKNGYSVEQVPGVTSFCAAAARMNIPLAEWDESLHILPAAHKTNECFNQSGTYVLMKSGKNISKVKDIIRHSGRDIYSIENCGMADEKIYGNVDEIPDDAGYFTLIVAKERCE
ncbi:MAG: precorrin-2 C(20)-methyltransferase [Firmicutes bacterium]|nr:precorrin-2 C(20)-methyltransferase [Bacillota bacterium]